MIIIGGRILQILIMLVSIRILTTEFDDYGINDRELEELKASLNNNQRAGNSLVTLNQ